MRSLWIRRELISALVAREMKARYKGSSLGLLWSLLTPLFMALIYAFFFRLLSGRAANTSSIIIGVFAWQFTAISVQQGLICISNNGNLVKKVFFPRVILPLATTSAAAMDYLISLIIQFLLVGFLLWKDGSMFGWPLLVLPLLVIWHFVLNMALAMFLGALNVYFRDTQHLVGVALSALFFLSPAMYDLSLVENLAAEALALDQAPWILDVYLLNPLASLFTCIRWAFLPGTVLPDSPSFWIGLALPLPLLLLATLFFKRLQRNFADFV